MSSSPFSWPGHTSPDWTTPSNLSALVLPFGQPCCSTVTCALRPFFDDKTPEQQEVFRRWIADELSKLLPDDLAKGMEDDHQALWGVVCSVTNTLVCFIFF